MRIGYSFWGFLGNGITDTPDGGRSHRRILIDALVACGHQICFLQANRDLDEAGDDLTGTYQWNPAGLPDLDALFLEWRWRIPGRNDTPCTSPGHTCDLHRQHQLLTTYPLARHTPTIIWDKDQQLADHDPLRQVSAVQVCEAALRPRPGTHRLLFPVADHALDTADPAALCALPRDVPLVYIGNQYDRDEDFSTYFAPAAATLTHRVAGKWPRTEPWPHVRFTGRLPFHHLAALYHRSVATVLLSPPRYAASGQITQRAAEAILAGCLPLAPATLAGADTVLPTELIVADGHDVAATTALLCHLAGSNRHVDLLHRCLAGLDPYRASRQAGTVHTILTHLTTGTRP